MVLVLLEPSKDFVLYNGVDNGTAAIFHTGTVKPDFTLVKGMTDGSRMDNLYSALGATKYFQFDATNAGTNSGPSNDTEPTSTLYSWN